MVTENNRLKQEARKLLKTTDMTIYDIATKLNRSKTWVSGIKQQLEAEEDGYEVDAVSTLSPLLVLKMADKVREENPDMANDLTHLADGLHTLSLLESKTHTAMNVILDRCEDAMADPDTNYVQFLGYADMVLKVYATLANKSGVIVNLNQQTTTNNTVVVDALKAEREKFLQQNKPKEIK